MSRKVGIAALIWGGSLLLSRVIGIIREGVIGRILGGGADADVYLAAFRIPDFLNYLLAGGALSIIFIPIFAGHLARDEEDKGWEAYSVIANTVLLLLAVALPLAWLATPWVVDNWLASGFAAEDRAHLSRLTRIVLPAQVFWEAEGYHQDFYLKNPSHYSRYRTGCGRDARLQELWGDQAGH